MSRFKTSDWLIVGGGIAFFIGGFLDWISVDFEGLGSSSGGNAFDFFFTGIVPWILIIGAAVITFLLAGGVMKPGTTPWNLILLAATALGALLVLIRFIAPAAGEEVPDELDVGRGIGLIICTIAAIVAAVGAALKFREAGGSFGDLTNRDRLRTSFSGTRTDDAPPPPPPPAPPPPPVP